MNPVGIVILVVLAYFMTSIILLLAAKKSEVVRNFFNENSSPAAEFMYFFAEVNFQEINSDPGFAFAIFLSAPLIVLLGIMSYIFISLLILSGVMLIHIPRYCINFLVDKKT